MNMVANYHGHTECIYHSLGAYMTISNNSNYPLHLYPRSNVQLSKMANIAQVLKYVFSVWPHYFSYCGILHPSRHKHHILSMNSCFTMPRVLQTWCQAQQMYIVMVRPEMFHSSHLSLTTTFIISLVITMSATLDQLQRFYIILKPGY